MKERARQMDDCEGKPWSETDREIEQMVKKANAGEEDDTEEKGKRQEI
jgi:hypothetical protein